MLVIGLWKGCGGVECLISGKDVWFIFIIVKSFVVEWVENEGVDLRDMGFGYGERGEIWVFSFGFFVIWGLIEEEGKVFLR